jgi:preprotein translocase SecE subunit
MARNRQRAKDRKQKLHRENIPGSLDHASGEVEEVEAAIVAGARGEPVEPAAEGVAVDDVEDVEVVVDAAPLEDVDDEYADSERDADAATVEHGRLGKGAGDLAVTPDAHKPAGFRVTNFFRACWAELQRVDWPDRRQVGQATAVVLGFVVVAGAFLGLADVVAQRIVDFII